MEGQETKFFLCTSRKTAQRKTLIKLRAVLIEKAMKKFISAPAKSLKASCVPTQTSVISPTTKPANASIYPLGFDALPDSAFIREAQLVQSPKRPGSSAPLPFSAPTLWRKVKDGTFPAPHKLSTRVTAWSVKSVREWMTAQAMV